jgi:hypothetical protein
VGSLQIVNNKEDADAKLVALENKVTTIVEPAIQGLKDEVASSISTLNTNVEQERVKTRAAVEANKKDVSTLRGALAGISAGIPAASCGAIADPIDGLFWIKSKIDGKSVKVYCALNSAKKFVSLGGNGNTKGEAGAGCFGNTGIASNTKTKVWVDPDADVENPSNAVQKECGSGTSKTSPALTCKGIVKKYGKKPNGLYWIIGRNQEYAKDPKRVYCWNTDRQGGGWTLGLVSYYCGHQRPSFSGDASGTTGDINRGHHWLTNRQPGAYKLDDKVIRAVIGQPDHTNGGASAKASKFSYMSDQNGWNSYYAGSNREYLVMEGYTARWRFVRFQGMLESNPRTNVLTSYYWNSNYNGNQNAKGEGAVNWKGSPKCGKDSPTRPSGAGISCRGQYSGSPQTNPYGGRGCNKNIGHDRWHGDLHYYMLETNHDTYLYFCNGAQHSSNCRYALRTWFRTAEDDDLA